MLKPHDIAAASILLLAAAGCSTQAPALRSYRYADLVRAPETGRTMFEAPFVLEFAPGDRLPVSLGFEDASFELDPAAPPLALVAKQRCFVRIDGTGSGIRVSTDPTRFDEAKTKGAFGVGFKHQPTGPELIVQVKTPQPMQP